VKATVIIITAERQGDNNMTTQRKEVNLERFYTRNITAEYIVDKLKNKPWFRSATEFLEPCAGAGVWLDTLQSRQPHTPRLAYDLDPRHPLVKKQDYLKLNLGYKRGRVAIGNPPFGRRGKLAKQFINKLADECDYIVFLLPLSFVKPTLISDINPYLHKVEEMVMGNCIFSGPDVSGTTKVACVLQVWKKEPFPREKEEVVLTHEDFTFVKDPTQADFGVRTHGSGVGEVQTNLTGNESKTTWRFIRVADRNNISSVVKVFSNLPIKERANSTSTKQPCVGKRDLVELYASVVV